MSKIVSKVDKNAPQWQENQQYHARLVKELREKIHEAVYGGRDHVIERHRKRGKLLPRERIDLLLDPGTPFLELSTLAAYGQYGGKVHSAGVVTGVGIVHGTHVMIVANDSTVKGGAYYPETVKKHIRAQEIADNFDLPCIYLVDCGGAYLPEWERVFPDQDHFGNIFFRQCNMSSRGLPQLAAVFGVSTAGAAYIPALADEVVMVRENATIHLGGPSMVKIAINEDIDPESLGGAEMHTRVSGVSDFIAETEQEAIARIRDVSANLNHAKTNKQLLRDPQEPAFPIEEIEAIVNADFANPFDMKEVIARIIDGGEFVDFKPMWGTSLICGTAHIAGYPVGILANNGPLFADSSVKGAHFISSCEQRDIPLLFLQNVPGFMVGKVAEQGGISKHSAKLVYAMSCAKVPRFTVVVGGSYGAGNYGMCGRGFRPDFMFAWPNSVVATMGVEVQTNVILEMAKNSISRKLNEDDLEKLRDETMSVMQEKSNCYFATSRLWDDGVIEPCQTRDVIALCLALAATKERATGRTHVYRM